MEEEKNYRYYTEYVHDNALQKEFLRVSPHLFPSTLFAHLLTIVLLIWLALFTLFMKNGAETFSGSMIFLTILYLVIEGIRFLSNLGGGIHYKRMNEANGGKPPRCGAQFFDDKILSLQLDTESKSIISYDQIKAIYETDRYFLLALKYKLFLIVDKKSLTGSREEFTAFLLDHCTKIKKKKVHNIRPRQIVNTVKWILIFVLFFIAVAVHPALQLKERMLGQIHNGMDAAEILAELEDFGITCEEPEIVERMYGSTIFFYGSRLESILHYIGLGEYDFESNRQIPSENGVLYVYLWADNTDTLYTDLLENISTLNRNELIFENLQEAKDESGKISVSFTLNGNRHTLQAEENYGEYDIAFLAGLSEILSAETGNSLYFAEYSGMGYFIFFRDAQWAEQFSRRTGIELTTVPEPLY